MDDKFAEKNKCIMITGKGEPDIATRMFLKRMSIQYTIPIIALMDSDPYGLEILITYKWGSKNMCYDVFNLAIPSIKWLGVFPSDIDKYKIPIDCRIKMTDDDIKKGKELLLYNVFINNPLWKFQLETMIANKYKAEIQCFSKLSLSYLSSYYLPLKLLNGDWI